MTFDEWWKIKGIDKANIPGILKTAWKELVYEAWRESKKEDKNATNTTRT